MGKRSGRTGSRQRSGSQHSSEVLLLKEIQKRDLVILSYHHALINTLSRLLDQSSETNISVQRDAYEAMARGVGLNPKLPVTLRYAVEVWRRVALVRA